MKQLQTECMIDLPSYLRTIYDCLYLLFAIVTQLYVSVEEDVMETTEQDEPNKSSGTLVWTLDLSEFNDTTFSPPLYVRNLPW